MGQYYKPTNLNTMEQLCSHDYDNGLKLMEHSYIGNNFVRVVEGLLSEGEAWYRCRLVWAGDYMDEGLFLPDALKKATVYSEGHEIKPKLTPKCKGHFLVNHTKKVCLDLKAEKGNGETWGNSKHPIVIHPLPLLTCSGNGRGGGDYNGIKEDLVGSWAGDEISIETKAMYDLLSPCNFSKK